MAESVPQACNFIKKETLTQVFFCEFCEISKNTFLQSTSGRLLLKIEINNSHKVIYVLKSLTILTKSSIFDV